MDESALTRSCLERLSTAELYRTAELYGLDIPSDLDRIFIIEELLDFAAGDENDQPEYQNAPVIASGCLEPVPLPKQYNITFIEAIIRDPLWVFVFWEVKSSDRDLFERDPDFSGYHLKVSLCSRSEPAVRERISPEDAEKEGVFIIPIGDEDTAWYLGFPQSEEAGPGTEAQAFDSGNRCYKVELCAGRGGEEVLLAVSNSFWLPELPKKSAASKGAPKNPLVVLSGSEDFDILRSGDRQSRIKLRGNQFPG
jgi:hypothetical protein